MAMQIFKNIIKNEYKISNNKNGNNNRSSLKDFKILFIILI